MNKKNNAEALLIASFGGLLALLFIALKLTGHIAWSWLWVLFPIWIRYAIVLLVYGIVFALPMNQFRRAEKRMRDRKRGEEENMKDMREAINRAKEQRRERDNG